MAKPLVAIVGRPNVGKSTFFNQMAGHRIAIVEDTPGVTRDRVYADCEWQNYKFTLIDTGGIDPLSDDPLLSQMRRQAEIAIETCDVILFFVDGKAGLTADDQTVADMLRRSRSRSLWSQGRQRSPMDNIYESQPRPGRPDDSASPSTSPNFGEFGWRICRHFDPDAGGGRARFVSPWP